MDELQGMGEQERMELLRARFNGETGRMTWEEVAPLFARGVVIRVAGDLDLIEVAVRVNQDDKAAVEAWIAEGRVARATTDHAVDWNARRPEFWAVVTAPWVLVQETPSHHD